MQVVLLSGPQGSGKTSIQKTLMQEWYSRKKESTIEVNFADVLYEMHNAILGILHRYRPKRNIVKDGPLLQLLGTNWGRKYLGDNVWVDILKEKVRMASAHISKNALIIVGDCRFENEFDAFPEALRVRLVCPEPARKKRCSMWREDTMHPSEIGLNAYSDSGKFDLYLDTFATPVNGCVDLIIAQLDKGAWPFKRK